MANPFTANGAVPRDNSHWAPLTLSRFWTGLYSNGNPLAEPAVPYLLQRFYSGSRYDTLRGGLNTEISPRLTIIRRPGNSVYNSQTFSAVNTFESFRVFDPVAQTTNIRVIADTASAVYDATGPSTKTLLFTKLAGAGQTSFQSVGNTLYAGDGVSTWKYLWNPAWAPVTAYNQGDTVNDTSGSIQTQLAGQWNSVTGVTNISLTSNVVTITFQTATIIPVLSLLTAGQTVIINGATTATFVNLVPLVVSSVAYAGGGGPANWTLTATLYHPDYASAADTGSLFVEGLGSASGSSTPSWAVGIGSLTADGLTIWQNKGPAVRTWGIVPPISAPDVSNIPNTNLGSSWAANTYYNPSLCIVDSNNNIQLLTTAGTTGSGVPTWNVTPGGTTADNTGGGTAVWTNQGSGVRATTHAYAVGAIIAVTYSYTYTIKLIDYYREPGHVPVYSYEEVIVGPYYYFFKCTVAGTSSSTATAQIKWQTSTVVDGTVTWTQIGPQITRTASATSAGNFTSKGNIGNSLLVSTDTEIVDSNGSFETVTSAGESGATAPTWATASGKTTVDNQAKWNNGGPATSANTGAWVYGYAFQDSLTGHVSSMSPASSQIVLASGDLINVAGSGDPNYATDGTDTIVIYRSVQGFQTPFLLTTIPAPANGGPWSYQDNSPDPPATGSILNEFISADTTGNNAPPPIGLTRLSYYLNRIFGTVGEFGYYSGVVTQRVGVGVESFGGENFWQLPESINRQWPSATGLLIFTSHGVFLSQGVDGNFNPNTPIQLLEDIGLLSENCFTVNGSIPTLFTSDYQMLSLDPSAGVSIVSQAIANLVTAFSNTNSYLTWHVNGTDAAFYLADGSTGWYRLSPISPPESGQTWSPLAQIVGGVRAVKSIETAPGVKRLLLGPSTSGPILTRDLTTNADNGTAYLANVVIGSIVFAQPGQCGEIDFVSTLATAIGSHPTVGILGQEISGTFEALAGAVSDPPFLNTPVSLYSDRFYFSTLQQPAWMRHCQLQISWPAENAANELLELSLFGTVHSEGK